MNVSVALATFNGEKFLKEQLDSILPQLGPDDEIIASDDGSRDGTMELLARYTDDPRITLCRNPGKGLVSNFENALKQCRNEIVFLCDQDDIWLAHKVQTVRNRLMTSGKKLVLHNALLFPSTEHQEKKMLIQHMYHGIFLNIIKSCYWGCCMAFTKELLDRALPFPPSIPTHDPWIGLIAEQRKETFFLNEPLILHRRHGKNVSKTLPLHRRLDFRYRMAKAYYAHSPKEP